MQIKGALHLARQIIMADRYDITVDCTMGNGYDTLLLAERSREVYAFDLQEIALVNTKKRLEAAGLNNVHFLQDSHANIHAHLSEKIDLFVYNLGYLPGSSKELTTRAEVVRESLEQAVQLLSEKGKILIVVYPGHAEGAREWEMLQGYVKRLKQNQINAFTMRHENGANNPAVLVIMERNASS